RMTSLVAKRDQRGADLDVALLREILIGFFCYEFSSKRSGGPARSRPRLRLSPALRHPVRRTLERGVASGITARLLVFAGVIGLGLGTTVSALRTEPFGVVVADGRPERLM